MLPVQFGLSALESVALTSSWDLRVQRQAAAMGNWAKTACRDVKLQKVAVLAGLLLHGRLLLWVDGVADDKFGHNAVLFLQPAVPISAYH